MDELDQLARVRADVPELDRFTAARIRNEVLTAARTEADDVPVVAAAGSGGPVAAPEPAGGRRRRRGLPVRVGVAAAAVAAMVAGGVAVTGLTDGSGAPIGATAAAAELLDRAATAASRAEPLPAPRADQVLYRRQVGQQLAGTMGGDLPRGTAVDHPCGSVHEMWMPVAPDAGRTMRRTDGVVTRPGNVDPLTLPRDPACSHGSFAHDLGPAEEDTWEGPAELAALPTDPRELYELVAGRSVGQGASDAEGTLANLVTLASFASPFLSPRQVAAIYRAMKHIPGVDVVGRGEDMLGRSGVVIGRKDAARPYREEVVFDPDTGRMLGDRQVVVDPDADLVPGGKKLAAGDILWQSVITVSVVDRVNQRPTS